MIFLRISALSSKKSSKPKKIKALYKGQLISKGPFDVILSSKKPMIFLRISALAYKKVSDQKI